MYPPGQPPPDAPSPDLSRAIAAADAPDPADAPWSADTEEEEEASPTASAPSASTDESGLVDDVERRAAERALVVAWHAAQGERVDAPQPEWVRSHPLPPATTAPSLLVTSRSFAHIPPVTLGQRWSDILLSSAPHLGLLALQASGALAASLPEVEAMVGFGDDEWKHKDVWAHTRQVVQQSVPRPAIRWAALLHDIGKVHTRSLTPDNRVQFLGHAEVGARMFGRVARRTGWFPEEELRKEIKFLIRNHLRAIQYESSWTDSAVRRFAREVSPYQDDLLLLSRADMTTKRQEKKRRNLFKLKELEDRIELLAAEDARIPPLPSGIGNVIMEAFSLRPSPRLGELKLALEQLVASGELPGQQPAEFYMQYLRDHRDHFGL